MESEVTSLSFNLPQSKEDLLKFAFPQARPLIASEGYQSASDLIVFKHWVEHVLIPKLAKAETAVKEGLKACLEPRTTLHISLAATSFDFIAGQLPHYPQGLVPTVAAITLLVAYELDERGLL